MQINLVDLVFEIRKAVLLGPISNYEKIFSSEIPDINVDQYSDAVRFYQSLNEEKKPLAFFLVRLALCEAVAAMLAWLDGKYFFENQAKELELKFEGEKDKLNGDLMEIWWAIEEGEDIVDLRQFYDNINL